MGPTASPTLAAMNSAGSSIAPKWSPMKMAGRPGVNASSTASGVSTTIRDWTSSRLKTGVRATSR